MTFSVAEAEASEGEIYPTTHDVWLILLSSDLFDFVSFYFF